MSPHRSELPPIAEPPVVASASTEHTRVGHIDRGVSDQRAQLCLNPKASQAFKESDAPAELPRVDPANRSGGSLPS